MKKFIGTIRNIFSIEELRQRIVYTLGFLLIYRLGTYVVIPGVNPVDLANAHKGSQDGILQLINIFAGGAFSRASIFALGIMPYISASIILQLLTMALPYFQRLQREGESGRKKINQYTRYLTVAITTMQAIPYLASQVVDKGVHQPDSWWWFQSVLVLVTGTIFVMWLGEKITDKGIGNGISLIIMIGIVARLPFAISTEFGSRLEASGGGLIMFLVELAVLLAVIVGCILLVQGTRRIPIHFAKRIVGNRQYGGQRNYIPLKVNAAGVMPIIFAQAIVMIPIQLAGFATKGTDGETSWFMREFGNHYGLWYNVVTALLIIVFTYFYTAITVNPNNMAEEMKRNEGYIPGVKPGKKTAEYIDTIMSRITLPGAFMLAIVAILPAIVINFGVSNEFASFYGGTSILIMVGVILDTLQQIESYLLMRHYDGLMKSGRIKGRTSVGMTANAQY
jgi:preprotein translocase subunit SecY